MSARTKIRIILTVIALLAVFAVVFYPDKIEVTGNTHMPASEIRSMVSEDPMAFNSVFLCLRNRARPLRPGGFIDSVSLGLKNPRCVIAKVTEKKMAGYFSADGTYWYFDTEGVVQAASVYTEEELTGGKKVPYVTGIGISGVTLGEPLPGAGTGIYGRLGSLADVLSHDGIEADYVVLENGRVTVWYGTVGVMLGDLSFLDIRIARMKAILPETEGLSGILHLEGYDGTEDGVIFEKDITSDPDPKQNGPDGEGTDEDPDAAGETDAEESSGSEDDGQTESPAEPDEEVVIAPERDPSGGSNTGIAGEEEPEEPQEEEESGPEETDGEEEGPAEPGGSNAAAPGSSGISENNP